MFLLLVLVKCAASTETDQKREKAFSIFNVVNFQNIPCRSQDTITVGTTPNRNGTCYTSSECLSNGGVASGNCASGFGVCCLFKVSATSSTISQNNTYIQNPSFPAVYTGTVSSLSYTVKKPAINICWLRLDFESFVITGPTGSLEVAGGSCATDTFTIVNPTKQRIPTICGQNNGQHMYIDFGNVLSDTVGLAFTFTGTSTVRTWEIKTSQIECSNPNRPPAGCLQYFTTLIGRITTFNFLDSTTTHLASQDYSICVKQQQGFCCVQYEVCTDQTNPFTLDVTAADQTAQAVDQSCFTTDYIGIEGSNSVCTSANNAYVNNKFCGTALGSTNLAATAIHIPICDCTSPFIVRVYTDATQDNGATTIASRGVCLDYSQLPCTTS